MGRRLQSLFSILPIKRTDVVGDDKSTIVAFQEQPPSTPGDPIDLGADADESTPIDWWQHYGFLSRPPDGAESLVVWIGSQAFSLASRALAAAGVWGKMTAGDVALYSVGKNAIRLNATGSISMLVPSNGKQIVVSIQPKGAIQFMLANGFYIELSEEQGFVVSTPGKDITLSGLNVNVNAMALNNNSAVLKTTIAASQPLVATSVAPGVFV